MVCPSSRMSLGDLVPLCRFHAPKRDNPVFRHRLSRSPDSAVAAVEVVCPLPRGRKRGAQVALPVRSYAEVTPNLPLSLHSLTPTHETD